MNHLYFASILAGLSITNALAADLMVTSAAGVSVPSGPGYNWSGYYMGLNVGAGWNRDRGAVDCVDNFGVINGPSCQILPPSATGAVHASGVLGGGQVGYNQQYGHTVLGLEADLQGSGISGVSKVDGPFGFAGYAGLALPAGAYTASEKIDWFGTLRGRLGYAVLDRALIYVTGGLAFGRIAASSNFTAPGIGAVYVGDISATNVGWIVGGGIEHALTNDLTMRLEGLYYDLGAVNVIGTETPPLFTPNPYQHNKAFDASGVLFRAGLNYKFISPDKVD